MKEVKRLIRCENGHFYDGGKYDECPHCNNSKTPDETVFIEKKSAESLNIKNSVSESDLYENEPETINTVEKNKTDGKNAVEFSSKNEDFVSVEKEKPIINPKPESNENFTVHYFEKTIGTEPVVGWLVCTKGAHFGEDFKIKSGRNFIGRAGNMNISLSSDKSVSRERHAILTYDPKSNTFMLQPGDSSELCYLNEELVLIPTKLNAYDRIFLGETELMFVPFCSDAFSWNKAQN